jgi:ribosomal protein L16/L10AE
VEHDVAKEAFKRCAAKLPVRTRFIARSMGAF